MSPEPIPEAEPHDAHPEDSHDQDHDHDHDNNSFSPFLGNEKAIVDLLGILRDGLNFFPPLYVNSVLGHPWTWLPPHHRHSEYSIVNPFRMIRTIKYLYDSVVPAAPVEGPDWLPGVEEGALWRSTEILFQTDPNNDPYSFPHEAWIYINGVGTNADLARINADLITQMFGRPLTIIQNATDSIPLDIIEAAIGKAWKITTEASAKAYPFIREALEHKDKKRVVVLCHSQGTIIMANVLRALINDEFRRRLFEEGQKISSTGRKGPSLEALQDRKLLKKLEIYTFANCADVMRYAPRLRSRKGRPVPYIENFCNEFDLVARLGVLAPNPARWGIRIDGEVYRRPGAWGHCLNLHYLFAIRDHLKDPRSVPDPYPFFGASGDPHPSRLYEYWNGGVPERY